MLTIASGCCLVLAFVGDGWTLGWRSALEERESGQVFAASLLYVISALMGILTGLPKAWVAVQRSRLEINVQMVIAVTGAIAIGQYAEAATVSFLFAVSLERPHGSGTA